MAKEIYPVRTFTLTLRTTDTPTGNDAARRLAMVLKYAGRVQGFRCVRSEEVKQDDDLRSKTSAANRG